MQSTTRTHNLVSRLGGFLMAGACGILVANFSLAADSPTKPAVTSSQKGAETPEKLISQIADYCLAGDSTNLVNCFDTSTRVHEIGAKSFAISIEIVKAKTELREALVRKFGAEPVSTMTGTYLLPAGESPLKKLSDSFQKPIVKIDGDSAEVTFGSNSEIPLKLERKNKRWFLLRELEGMAVADEEEAYDRMEGNRYYVLGLRDAVKIVPETKSIQDADKQITAAVNQQVGNFLTQPAPEPKK